MDPSQGSILGPVLSLVYINNLAHGWSSVGKSFADNISLFLVIYDVVTSANELNNDLYQINKCSLQWKMSFNPDPRKQAQEIIFSRKTKKISHPSFCFDNDIVSQTPYQKHLSIFLDAWLMFEEHLKVITTKVNRTIRLLQKLQKTLPRSVLMTVYKAFVRPHLDYGDIIYSEAYNEAFHQKFESVQYNTCLALSGTIRGLSREKLYHGLGLESLQCWRWYRKLCLFSDLSMNSVWLHTCAHIHQYLFRLSLHLQNIIWQVNCMPTLQEVCSVILLQIIHLHFYVEFSLAEIHCII